VCHNNNHGCSRGDFESKKRFETTTNVRHATRTRGRETVTSHATLPFICTTCSELKTALIRGQNALI
jgi:hypothetical protein